MATKTMMNQGDITTMTISEPQTKLSDFDGHQAKLDYWLAPNEIEFANANKQKPPK
jgi:hypothetical protein